MSRRPLTCCSTNVPSKKKAAKGPIANASAHQGQAAAASGGGAEAIRANRGSSPYSTGGGGVTFAVGDGDGDPRHLTEQLARMQRCRFANRLRIDYADGYGGLGEERFFTGAGYGDRR